MRSRSSVRGLALAILFAFLALVVATPRLALADVRGDIQAKVKDAMENYDLFEYDAARKLLNQALSLSKKNKLERDPLTAKVNLALGIVSYLGLQDEDAARLAFLDATSIDPKIEIDAAYRTPEMAALLEEARASSVGPAVVTGDNVDCSAVTGLEHALVAEGPAGKPVKIVAHLGSDTAAAKVELRYRGKGQTEFKAVDMVNTAGCTYEGAIPADATRGDMAYYYVAALDPSNDVLAQRGNSGSPNLVELTGTASAVIGDGEDPLGGGNGGVVHGGKPAKVFVALNIGSGIGYVTGTTEQAMNDVGCCVAPALLHIAPELGFMVTPHIALSLVGRFGLTIGANIEGHAGLAPSALLRLRYRPGTTGAGVHVNGALGGGVMRNTIKLGNEVGPGMDTDIVAFGPLLLGAGVGYGLPLGAGKARLIADFNATAGLPVIDKIGEASMNFGIEFDASLGVLVGF